MNGKVLILLATHNRAHFIGATLDSIISQTYPNWECLVIDDNSVDNTMDVVSQYVRKDSRIFYHKKEKKYGARLPGTRNQGLDMAPDFDPEFLQFFDDDDIMHPKKLELQIESLNHNQETCFSLCSMKNFVSNSEILGNERNVSSYRSNLTLGEAYLTSEVKLVAQVPVFRYSYVRNFRFDESLFFAEDWELFSKEFLRTNPKYNIVDNVLVYRRKHKNSMTENDDSDYERRKASAIVKIKVFDYLKEHNIHSRITLFYFSRKFLLYQYDSHLLDQIQELFKNLNTWDYWRFKTARKFHWFFRKLVLRILNF
ncbi:glycosyl transferase [Salinimicrobium marinum]|uniref:Glycosyl transferase n=1 Tax=Salinimicrobium marinum TaxID=680283 RepID=A0A918SN94_9FLAO|nr:glycosyltransferase family 2 protein [Salinimicrobium marinum]GHA50422.1 glycosyl transferase [Salinimicrobium marinum]